MSGSVILRKIKPIAGGDLCHHVLEWMEFRRSVQAPIRYREIHRADHKAKINQAKELSRRGFGAIEIAAHLGWCLATAKKYLSLGECAQ